MERLNVNSKLDSYEVRPHTFSVDGNILKAEILKNDDVTIVNVINPNLKGALKLFCGR